MCELALALAASCMGFACLALSLPKHWEEVTGESTLVRNVTALRAVGYSALALALALTWLRNGSGFGSVLWVFLLSTGAAAVAFTLPWRPGWLKTIAFKVAMKKKRYRVAEER